MQSLKVVPLAVYVTNNPFQRKSLNCKNRLNLQNGYDNKLYVVEELEQIHSHNIQVVCFETSQI
jgi:hypothetical protein